MIKTSWLILFIAILHSHIAFCQEGNQREIGINLAPPINVPSMGSVQYNDRLLQDGKRKSIQLFTGLSFCNEINDFLSLRVKVGFTIRSIEENRDVVTLSGSSLNESKTYKQTGFSLFPGLLSSHQVNKFNFYFGLETPMIFYGKGNQQYTSYEIEPSLIYYDIKTSTTFPGGFSIGLGSFAGIKINIGKNIMIGPEFSFALLYSKLGGKIIEETSFSSSYSTGNDIYTRFETLSQFSFSQVIGSINFSIRFN